MRTAFTLLVLLTCWRSVAQQLVQVPASALRTDADTELLIHSETVQVPNASQAELYARAQGWFATAYQTTKEVTRATDKEASVVQGSGWREIEMLTDGEQSIPLRLWYTINIAVQPGRYTYAITEFQTQSEPTPADTSPKKQALEQVLSNTKVIPTARTYYKEQATDTAHAVAVTIQAAMVKPSATTNTKKAW